MFPFIINLQLRIVESIGRIQTGDQPIARPPLQQDNTNTENCIHISMPKAGFEPTIPVLEQMKTFHALDCTATVIGVKQAVNAKWLMILKKPIAQLGIHKSYCNMTRGRTHTHTHSTDAVLCSHPPGKGKLALKERFSTCPMHASASPSHCLLPAQNSLQKKTRSHSTP
jgi:hypothetical protein